MKSLHQWSGYYIFNEFHNLWGRHCQSIIISKFAECWELESFFFLFFFNWNL